MALARRSRAREGGTRRRQRGAPCEGDHVAILRRQHDLGSCARARRARSILRATADTAARKSSPPRRSVRSPVAADEPRPSALPPSQLASASRGRPRRGSAGDARGAAATARRSRARTAWRFSAPSVQAFVLQGLGHADATVRAAIGSRRSPPLRRRPGSPRAARSADRAALGGELSPSCSARPTLARARAAARRPLRAALDDAPTLARCARWRRRATGQLRALATFRGGGGGRAQLKLHGLGRSRRSRRSAATRSGRAQALGRPSPRGAGGPRGRARGSRRSRRLARRRRDADPMARAAAGTLQCLANILDRGGLGAEPSSPRSVASARGAAGGAARGAAPALALLHGAAASVRAPRRPPGDADDPCRAVPSPSSSRSGAAAPRNARRVSGRRAARLCETAADDAPSPRSSASAAAAASSAAGTRRGVGLPPRRPWR